MAKFKKQTGFGMLPNKQFFGSGATLPMLALQFLYPKTGKDENGNEGNSPINLTRKINRNSHR